MKIYGLPVGVPTQIALTTAFQKGYELELVPFMPDGKANKTPEFLAKNPRGQIPTLEDGETYVSESFAILRYILAKNGEDSDFWPADALARTKIEVQLAHIAANLLKAHSDFFYQTYGIPKWFGGATPSEEKAKELKDAFTTQVGHVKTWLAHNGGAYLTGDALTVADIVAWAIVHNAVDVGIYSFDDHPEVKAWFEKVGEEPGPQATRKAIEESLAAIAAKKAAESG